MIWDEIATWHDTTVVEGEAKKTCISKIWFIKIMKKEMFNLNVKLKM